LSDPVTGAVAMLLVLGLIGLSIAYILKQVGAPSGRPPTISRIRVVVEQETEAQGDDPAGLGAGRQGPLYGPALVDGFPGDGAGRRSEVLPDPLRRRMDGLYGSAGLFKGWKEEGDCARCARQQAGVPVVNIRFLISVGEHRD